MTQVDPSYDVILTYSPIIEITGHIFECFDYYLFLRQHCKAGILFFCGLKKEQLKIAFESKYTVPFSSIEKDFIILDTCSHISQLQIVSFGKNTIVIIADGNIKSLEYNHIYLAAQKLYGFMCEYDNFHEVQLNKHITYLQDYRIYGKNQHFRSIDYVKKIPFRFYNNISRKKQNVGMMYVTFMCRKVTPEIIHMYFEKSKCDSCILVVPYKLPEYDGILGVTQTVAPVDKFFSKFDKYIYTPVARHFDCSPRLVTECYFYNKDVIIDLDYNDIGLQTRINDCKKDISKLDLNDNDMILDLVCSKI